MSKRLVLRHKWAVGLGIVAASVLVAGLDIPATASASTVGGSSLVRSSRVFEPAAVPTATSDLGAVPATQSVSVEVILAPSNAAGLGSLLSNLYNPTSSVYQQWLTASQFKTEFGPAGSTVSSADSWLRSRGLSPHRTSTFALTVTASASKVSSALGVTFERYRAKSGNEGFMAREAPLVPAGLSNGEISAVLGLDTMTQDQTAPSGAVQHLSSVRASATPDVDGLTACPAAAQVAAAGYYTLDQLGAAYGVGSLLDDGLDGAGQTIAVYELAPHSGTDVSTYATCFGLSNSVSSVPVDGGGTSSAGGTGEADLDIEQAMTQAPGASVISYEGPNTPEGAYDTWYTIVQADQAKEISTSWGECEPDAVEDGSLSAYTTLFEEAASQGQTVVASSGDSGSEGCFISDGTTDAEVTYPASDPWATAVGGTSLWGPGDETAWNSCQDDESTYCAEEWGGQAAGGGGLSRYEPELSYQPQILYWPDGSSCGTYCREVPDISANSGIGMVVYANGSWEVGDGTSFATPFMAGLIADKNQGCSTYTGAFTPSLYDLYDDGAYGTAFNDITAGDTDMTGSNDGAYPAEDGYDAATGVGSPIAAGLSCPEIMSISPASSWAGSTVTVHGLGLEKATISFGSAPAQVVSANATSAVVKVPAGSGTARVAAVSPLGEGTTSTTFAYTAAPPPPPPVCSTATGPVLGNAVGVAAVDIDGCDGYFVANSAGQVSAFGSAVWHGDLSGIHLYSPIIAIEATKDGGGYWLLGADGGVFTFGDAHFYGSTGGIKLVAPVVGMAVTNDGGGYWVVAKDGGVFTFGDAGFFGSTGGVRLNKPIDGIAVAPDGNGYWLVASDGGVFTFTGDGFFGSLGGVRLAKPIIGMSSTPDGRGYTLVGSDGGVFTFGDARFYGSLGGSAPQEPVVDLSPAPSDDGYYLVTSAGQIFAFGPAAKDFGNA